MDERLRSLAAAINRWRARHITEYWVEVSYIGSAVNRFGDHELAFANGTLWHRWDGGWRAIEKGSDFWLFSVPGAFAWAHDALTKLVPPEAGTDAVELEFDDEYGYVKLLRVRLPQRDVHNFTFEVRRFGVGPHPEFER